jgi:hypothetical protein
VYSCGPVTFSGRTVLHGVELIVSSWVVMLCRLWMCVNVLEEPAASTFVTEERWTSRCLFTKIHSIPPLASKVLRL